MGDVYSKCVPANILILSADGVYLFLKDIFYEKVSEDRFEYEICFIAMNLSKYDDVHIDINDISFNVFDCKIDEKDIDKYHHCCVLKVDSYKLLRASIHCSSEYYMFEDEIDTLHCCVTVWGIADGYHYESIMRESKLSVSLKADDRSDYYIVRDKDIEQTEIYQELLTENKRLKEQIEQITNKYAQKINDLEDVIRAIRIKPSFYEALEKVDSYIDTETYDKSKKLFGYIADALEKYKDAIRKETAYDYMWGCGVPELKFPSVEELRDKLEIAKKSITDNMQNIGNVYYIVSKREKMEFLNFKIANGLDLSSFLSDQDVDIRTRAVDCIDRIPLDRVNEIVSLAPVRILKRLSLRKDCTEYILSNYKEIGANDDVIYTALWNGFDEKYLNYEAPVSNYARDIVKNIEIIIIELSKMQAAHKLDDGWVKFSSVNKIESMIKSDYSKEVSVEKYMKFMEKYCYIEKTASTCIVLKIPCTMMANYELDNGHLRPKSEYLNDEK